MKNSGDRIRIMGTGQRLYKKAKKLIPGGTQLLSKRPEMFSPDIWPAYYSRAKGYKIWDMDGIEYNDMSIMGVGANILGYADEDVDSAVKNIIESGVSSTLNCPEEIELAEILIQLHPWADMVRYTRCGGEACAMAIRIARTSTKREIIMFSGYHGWTDWYLSANLSNRKGLDGHLLPGLEPRGVPSKLIGTAIPFHFGDLDELKSKANGKEKEIAAIIVEPARGEEAPKDYLLQLKEYAKYINAVLIFDEITSGFRMCAGGLHLKYGVKPDIAIFAKSISNGYAMAAVIGKEKIMSAAQRTFMSSTNWTERIGPTAAIATINKYMDERVADYIIDIGKKVKLIWKKAAAKHGLNIVISGLPSLASFSFSDKKSQTKLTIFTIEMLKRGFLGFRQFKPSLAHDDNVINRYEQAVDEIFEIIARDDSTKYLETPVAHTGFKRLTTE